MYNSWNFNIFFYKMEVIMIVSKTINYMKPHLKFLKFFKLSINSTYFI